MLLCDSVERYAPEDLEHYVIVSSDDEQLFRKSKRPRTKLLIQEKMVSGRYWKVPLLKNWRFSFSTPPIRGWIWQQLVKLSIPKFIESEAILMLDSDTFLTRAFDPGDLVEIDAQSGRQTIPLFVEEKDFYVTHSDTQKWNAVSRSLLGLPPLSQPSRMGYVSCYAYWRRDVVLKLHEHIRSSSGKSNIVRALAMHPTFSEYSLYGTFVDQVLGRKNSGHYAFTKDIVHAYWQEKPLSAADILDFRRTQEPSTFMAMINAKSETSVADIRSAFGFER